MKKIIAISASPREGNSSSALDVLRQSTLSKGYEYSQIKIKDKKIIPCNGCLSCDETGLCIFNDDMNEINTQLEQADLIIFISPVYFSAVPGIAKIFIDRLNPFFTSRSLEGKELRAIVFGQTEPEEMEYVIDYLKIGLQGLGILLSRSVCITAKDPKDFISNEDDIERIKGFID